MKGVNTLKKKIVIIAMILIVMSSVIYKYNSKESKLIMSAKTEYTLNETISPLREDTNKEYEIINSNLSLAELYKNIGELKKASDIIIEGEVKSTKSIIYHDMPFTVSEVVIYDLFKSNSTMLKKNGTVCIIENGGILDEETQIKSFKAKFPNKEINKKEVKSIKLINDGISPMDRGEHVIIFGVETYGILEKPCYFVLGVYQGKYKIHGDKVKHEVPKELEYQFEDKVEILKELIDLIKKS